MKWLNNRFLLMAYATVLTALVLIGCTSKEDPSEVLPLCNGHSCGDLMMVTTDTSSEGYQYLNPVKSPDGTRIAFTHDWWALPSDPYLSEDRPYTTHRQISVIPILEGIEPVESLTEQGAELIRLNLISLYVSGSFGSIDDALNEDKGGPTWYDDDTLIFWLTTVRGNRLFMADITNPSSVDAQILYQEPDDAIGGAPSWQHMSPAISPNREWLIFTRSGCADPDSFETCTGMELCALQMSTAGGLPDHHPVVFPLTPEVSRIETPRWSPNGQKIVFSAGLDMGDSGFGSGTELFTIDFDTTGLADYVAGAADMPLNNNLRRLTYTEYAADDPISGILNNSPSYSTDMTTIYFISTRRAPTTTLHDRNVWKIPANGTLDPEIVFFSRNDDVDVWLSGTGREMIFSSMMGFPNEMLDRLEDESYQRLQFENPGLGEVELRDQAQSERLQLEFFQGVMSHLYVFRNW